MTLRADMGSWGVGCYENDAALDWLGLFERVGFIAVATPMNEIGEYISSKKSVPTDVEQAFWASCDVIAIAAGLALPEQKLDQEELIMREAEKILKIPNLKTRVELAWRRLSEEETELKNLWNASGEDAAFVKICASIRERVRKALA